MNQMGPSVLVIDDDPAHLRLYSLILGRKGYHVHTALVRTSSVELEADRVDVVTLDYRLNSRLRATDVANLVRERYPKVPIIVLSEMEWMPDDMAPLAAAFVHKGNPEELLQTLARVAAKA